jgi:hypothetical protein
MDTRVAQRIREQQQLAAELRIQRLVQIRQVERERLEVDQSIRDMSQDLAAAQRHFVEHRPSLNLEDIRRQAREEWLALRAERWPGYRRTQNAGWVPGADRDHLPDREAEEQPKPQEHERDFGLDDDLSM